MLREVLRWEKQRLKDEYRDLSTAQGTMRLFPAAVEMTLLQEEEKAAG
jgi:hypothetical protein